MKLKPNSAAAWLAVPLVAMAMVACGDDSSSGAVEEDAGTDTSTDTGGTEAPGANCGDGVVDDDEDCDNGNLNGRPGNACTAFCTDNECGDGHRGPGEECDNDSGNCVDCQIPPPPARCGDGNVDPGEDCDLGNRNGVSGSACTANCLDNECGDGHIGGDEVCDDGNRNDNDACTNECELAGPACGNGVREAGEACDNGAQNGIDGNPCTLDCTVNVCGDEHVGPGEGCDEGDDNSDEEGASCTSSCTTPTCGDGIVQDGEQCDDGADNGSVDSSCTTACRTNVCGDGVVGADEDCDQGRGANGNGTAGTICTATCQANECGDGHRGPGEGCDLGEANSDAAGAACTTSCALPTCGDGIVQTGEECDEGAANANTAGAACTAACTTPTCGDNIQQTGEECDDGSNNSDTNPNHCRTDCRNAFCGDGVRDTESGEECDNGANNGPGRPCTALCKISTCGNGTVEPGEECDDGNTNNNDSCLTSCQWNSCGDGAVYTAVTDQGNPNAVEQCDDANTSNSDSCLNTCVYNVCSDSFALTTITEPYGDPDANGVMTASRAARDAVGANGAVSCETNVAGVITAPNPVDACRNDAFHTASSGNLTFSGAGQVLAAGGACTAGAVCFPAPWSHATAVVNDAFYVYRVQVEQCDDGNAVNTDACVARDTNGDGTLECRNATCGDGVVQAGVEECDDQNTNNNDSCIDTCKLNVCGDGWRFTVNAGSNLEACDDGNSVNTDLCSNACALLGVTSANGLSASCGDGVIQPGEGCDHGGTPTATCNANCQIPTCGNGIVEGAEQCDDGNNNNNDQCLNSCRWNVCGDGFRYAATSANPTNNQPLEECDDANSNDRDECTSSCAWNTCGDNTPYTHISHHPGAPAIDGSLTGIGGPGFAFNALTPGVTVTVCDNNDPPPASNRYNDCVRANRNTFEECDDGNSVNGDGCNSCVLSTCGDGVVDPGEACDDGNIVGGDGCEADCSLPPSCGDGIVQPGEACDGNDFAVAVPPGVVCLADCKVSTCGDGIKQGHEECDDGDTDNADSCTNRCLLATCGDGIVQLDGRDEVAGNADDEECDDGNDVETDSCTNNCKFNVHGDGIRYTASTIETHTVSLHACDTGAIDDAGDFPANFNGAGNPAGVHPYRHAGRAARVTTACAATGAGVTNCNGDGFLDETDFCGAWDDPTPANRGKIRCAPAAAARGITAWKSGASCLMPAEEHGTHSNANSDDIVSLDWYAAKAHCESYGIDARLAVINTAANRTAYATAAHAGRVAGRTDTNALLGYCEGSNEGVACALDNQCDSANCSGTPGVCTGGGGELCAVNGDCPVAETCTLTPPVFGSCLPSAPAAANGAVCAADGTCDGVCAARTSWVGLFDDFTGNAHGGTPVSTNPGRWYWLDGTLDNPANNTTRQLWKHTVGPPIVFTHPDGNGDCGVLDQGTNDEVTAGTEGWDDVGCTVTRGFMCEFPVQ